MLDDPARVARAVPGLQHDAGAEPVTGRLKLRIGGSSITYRGTVRVSARDDGSYAVEGEAAEARGNGTVRLSLRLTPRAEDAGTALVVTGTATADGRVTELPRDAVASAVTRLLSRFAENLGAAAETAEPPAPRSPRNTSEPATSSPASRRTSRPPRRGRPGPATGTGERGRLRRGADAGSGRDARAAGRGFPRRHRRSPPPRRRRRRRRRLPRRGRTRTADDDRPQRRGGRPRTSARPLRPGPRPSDGHVPTPSAGRPPRQPWRSPRRSWRSGRCAAAAEAGRAAAEFDHPRPTRAPTS